MAVSMQTADPLADGAGRPTRVRYVILALILLLATVAYADRAILSISGPGIKQQFGLSPVQLGFILSAFSWSYVVGQVPGGLLLDRLGTKAVYGVALVLWSIATFAIGLVGGVTSDVSLAIGLLFALRFVVGLVEGPSFPANNRVVVMWFPNDERGLATSLFASAAYFAVAIFSPLSGWLVSLFGWPAPFFALGVIGLASAGLWVFLMRQPRNHPWVSQLELDRMIAGGALVDIDTQQEINSRPHLSWEILGVLLGNRMLWCAYIGQYCGIALSYFFITWFPIYLVQARGMNIMQAGFATFVPSVAGFLGGMTGGAVSDMLIRRGWSVSWARKTPLHPRHGGGRHPGAGRVHRKQPADRRSHEPGLLWQGRGHRGRNLGHRQRHRPARGSRPGQFSVQLHRQCRRYRDPDRLWLHRPGDGRLQCRPLLRRCALRAGGFGLPAGDGQNRTR